MLKYLEVKCQDICDSSSNSPEGVGGESLCMGISVSEYTIEQQNKYGKMLTDIQSGCSLSILNFYVCLQIFITLKNRTQVSKQSRVLQNCVCHGLIRGLCSYCNGGQYWLLMQL